MKLLLKKGVTSQTALIFVPDSSSTTGAGLTGLLFNSASLTWYYYREAAGTGATQVTLATMTIGTWATGGFIELDATDMPGWYEIGIPDAVLATGADFVGMVLKGATNMAQVNLEIQLTTLDMNTVMRGTDSGATAANLATVDTVVDAIKAVTDLLPDAGALSDLATILADTNELQADDVPGLIAALNDPTVAAIADGVWDEILTGATHNIASSAGRRLRQIDAAFEVHAGTAQAGAAGTITLDTGASPIDDIYNGDRIIITEGTGAQEHGLVMDYDGTTKIATMSKNWVVTPDATSVFEIVPADVDIEMWNNSSATGDGDWAELQTDVDTALVDIAAVKAETALIVADTNELQSDDVPTLIAAVQADTDDIQTRLPAALASGNMVVDVLALNGVAASAANLERSAFSIVLGTVDDTVAPTTTEFEADDITEATADHFIGRTIIFTSGVLLHQATDITDYALAGGKGHFTVTVLTEAPGNNDTFVIV